MATVLIRGQGVAACCCAHLLRAAGVPVAVQPTDRGKLPAILIGEATQRLACDVFGQPDLFAGLPRIDKRIVAWGPNAQPVTLPHRAVVISEDALTERLRPPHLEQTEPDWTVYASRPLPAACVEHAFGTRTATAAAVTMKEDAAAVWMESVAAGWLFLISTGGGAGWLLSVGGPAESLLGESRLVAEQTRGGGSAGGTFPAYPRIATPLCGAGWLSCGTAAMAFDPICGDGTGYAIREGILAAAVIRAAEHGGDTADLLAHYRMRMIAGFRRHTELCIEFYRTGGNGPWWQAELDSLRRGAHWCRVELDGETFRYRLKGFDLQRVG